MPRYKLTIEYDGTPYVGWQRQNNGPSVQQALEQALAALSGELVVVNGAGRTDAGVHASAQVAHVDLAREWRTDVIRDGMNAHLRSDSVTVLGCERVAQDFDARFSAIKRHYRYIILNRRAPPAIDNKRVWHMARGLDAEAMHEAAQCLVGRHDFTTFRASECQAKSPVKTLDVLDVARDGERIEIRASALSFLHHQIRSIAGSLEHVGSGRWTKADLFAALEACDRKRCGVVAPPWGLYLSQVDYGD
ncbi:MAG: tRNA pseudouridine(38-40) synthase TruA [Hyphomicrobiales bacterium]|nr:tRNA pseudouridine(38-40) synthase TruA [Hyphomicrobiales bacterium]